MKWSAFLVAVILLHASQKCPAQSIEQVRKKGISYHEELQRTKEQLKLRTLSITRYEPMQHGGILELRKENLSDSTEDWYVEKMMYDSLNRLLYDSTVRGMDSHTYGEDSIGRYSIDTVFSIAIPHRIGKTRVRNYHWDTSVTVSRARTLHGSRYPIAVEDSVWDSLDTLHGNVLRLTYSRGLLREKYTEQHDLFGRLATVELRTYEIGHEKYEYATLYNYSIPHHLVSTSMSVLYPLDTLAILHRDFDSTTLCATLKEWSVYSGKSESVVCQDSDEDDRSNNSGDRHITFDRSQNEDRTEFTHRTYENGVLILERVERYKYDLWKK